MGIGVLLAVMALAIDRSFGQTVQQPFVTGVAPTQAIGSGRAYPSPTYFASFSILNDGDYKSALQAFTRETIGSFHIGVAGTGQNRWIDSICAFTMVGECQYRLGDYNNALDSYKAALQVYVQYANWMQYVQFPTTLNASNTARGTPWGKSTRGSRPARFQENMPILIGQSSEQIANAISRPGSQTTVIPQQMLSVNAPEIVRCTCLAMYRRKQILGPLADYDTLTGDVLDAANGRKGKIGHWSEAWLDVQQGMAYAAAGKAGQAAAALKQSLQMMQGMYDHQLTGLALVQLGQLSMQAGDFKAAGNYFEEATYTAYDFGDATVLEEAFRNLFLAHLMAGDSGTLDVALSKAAGWAHNKLRELEASVLLTAAESLALRGQTPQAVTMLNDASSAIGRHVMGSCEIGSRLNYLTAMTQYQRGESGNIDAQHNAITAGDTSLTAAMVWQKVGAKRLFQIGLADKLCLANPNGRFSPRVADLLYSELLRDPTPSDWSLRPLESLAVLTTPHLLPFDHWFEIIVKSSALDTAAEPALKVADLTRRHRFLSTLPQGGRLLSLQWVLEAPEDALDKQARLQRGELLARFPKYAEAASRARQLRAEIAQAGVNPDKKDVQRGVGNKFNELATITSTQEVMLHEIGVRREAADMVFPPTRSVKEIQKMLPPESLVLAFFNSSHSAYGWVVSVDRIQMWKLDRIDTLEKRTAALLKALGNYDANHDLQDAQLTDVAWKQSARDVVELLLKSAKTQYDSTFKEIVIVPEGTLWYLPFEMLPIGDMKNGTPLISRLRVRYAPTVGLSVPLFQGRKPLAEMGVMLGKLSPGDTPDIAEESLKQLRNAAPSAVGFQIPLPATATQLASVLDGLVVLDDIPAAPPANPYDWTPVPADKNKATSSLAAWLGLPWKSTDQVLLPGFHSAAENSLKAIGPGAGNDLFLATTGLMASGARTVLISRWRVGGQSAIDLLREFVQELPFVPADEAWQRAVQLVSQSPLDSLREPRVKRKPDAPPINADHPFFWSGYMLVDSGVTPEKNEPPKPKPILKLDPNLAGGKAAAPANPADPKAVPPKPAPSASSEMKPIESPPMEKPAGDQATAAPPRSLTLPTLPPGKDSVQSGAN
jgi:tetratricopeptide (TPR) repeat protein